MCEVLHQVDAFPHQFPKPKSISFQNLSDGGKLVKKKSDGGK
jgi:hypothetical protein